MHALIQSTLGLPDDYLVGIVPGSDTGAVEMAMWSSRRARRLGSRLGGVRQALGEGRGRGAEAGHPGLPRGRLRRSSRPKVDFDHDVVFWNGTASGVRVPDGDWIPMTRRPDDLRRDLVRLRDGDAVAQARRGDLQRRRRLAARADGVIILSPRAVERADSFRLTAPSRSKLQRGKLDRALFEGATINTPSLLVIEDAIDTLVWAEGVGRARADRPGH